MKKLPKDVDDALNRIFTLTVIKDDPSDDAFEALYKIGKVAREMLNKYNSEYRALAERKAAELRKADSRIRDIDKLQEVSRSGWTGDFYLDDKDLKYGIGVVFYDEPEYDELEALVKDWPYREELDGGVLVYVRPEAGSYTAYI